jgi:hypothetical protein
MIADRSWSRQEFVARPLGPPWRGKLQPGLAINPSRLVVAAGSTLYSYKFVKHSSDVVAPGLRFEGSCTLTEPGAARRDITSIVSLVDGGSDCTLSIGLEDGALERVVLIPPSENGLQSTRLQRSVADKTYLPDAGLIESLSSSGNFLLSLSSNGIAALFGSSSPYSSPQHINLRTKSWSSYLSVSSSTPFIAFGTSSATPLTIHSIADATVSATPSTLLSANIESDRFSAVYGICGAPVSSPWGHSDQIVISGWYDGVVRVHDLRSSRGIVKPDGGPRQLFPVISLHNPWSFNPIYAVSCGGGSSAHIAAGSARHSLVSFWDVRAPKSSGWSVHAPGNDQSPVYDLILESSRLFGVNQSRPFVYDFGSGVSADTYPKVPRYKEDGLEGRQSSIVSYYVTKYKHDRKMTSRW